MKTFVTALISLITVSLFAQNSKYENFMQKNMALLDSAKTAQDFQAASNGFERIAQVEKTQWLPNYYAAFALINQAFRTTGASEIEAIANKAKTFLDAAEMAEAGNSELAVLKAMHLQIMMMADPGRAMQLGPQSYMILQKARQEEPKGNPRVLLVAAQNTYYTPPAFGGGKEPALQMLNEALAAFDSFKPMSTLHPSWGKTYAIMLKEQWTK